MHAVAVTIQRAVRVVATLYEVISHMAPNAANRCLASSYSNPLQALLSMHRNRTQRGW
jgi:hypothetical protein